MRTYVISPEVQEKLRTKHTVTQKEIDECFDNKCGINLVDDREDNRTDPCTLWFIAETGRGRLLKVIFVYEDGKYFIKSSYEPDPVEIEIYERKGK